MPQDADLWKAEIRARRGSAPARLQELLIRQPVVTAKIVATELAVSEVAAQTAIDRLVDAGADTSTE